MSAQALVEDVSVWPTLTDLASCLCAEMSAPGLPELCFCGILPGAMAAYDFCGETCASSKCGGQAWVRLVGTWPSASFPSPANSGTCAMPLAISVELGVVRCAPSPDSRGNPPSLSDQFESARLQMADMAAMRRAVLCCAQTNRVEHQLGSYIPIGPEGGCLGGTWTASLSQF